MTAAALAGSGAVHVARVSDRHSLSFRAVPQIADNVRRSGGEAAVPFEAMSVDFDRKRKAGALIPNDQPLAQSIFKAATCLAYAEGLTIQDAIEFGIERAREDHPDFSPVYDVALLALDWECQPGLAPACSFVLAPRCRRVLVARSR